MRKAISLALLLFVSLTSIAQSQSVVICTGLNAYAYHRQSDCAGLNNCQGEKIIVNEQDAINYYDRSACCKCYPYSANCKDDAPQYYSGSGGAAAGYAAIGVGAAFVIAGVFILSNDVYCYPVYSFYNRPGGDNNPDFRNGTGWSFGFRKTFDYSAIEYGAHYIKYSFRLNNEPITRYVRDWGIRVNFVREIFFHRTPDNIRFYIGPTVNVFKKVGYGGIGGVSVTLTDRIKLDTRYELTTQTHQFQVGIIFKYQKEYFWKRNKSGQNTSESPE